MKAAVVHDFTRPLAVEDVPTPEPGDEQVLVRIEASGLCHTDIHAARGEWPVKPAPPFIPGHEGVGVVERVGAGNMHGLEEGMRRMGDVDQRGSAPLREPSSGAAWCCCPNSATLNPDRGICPVSGCR